MSVCVHEGQSAAAENVEPCQVSSVTDCRDSSRRAVLENTNTVYKPVYRYLSVQEQGGCTSTVTFTEHESEFGALSNVSMLTCINTFKSPLCLLNITIIRGHCVH